MDPLNNVLSPTGAALLREQYRAALFDDMIPWWERHSPDRECGGYYSCLERDGHAYAGDKFLWMVGRQIWTFSHLANGHEPRPEWIELARHGARFLLDHGFTDSGSMYFRLSREGYPRARCLSLYTECFAAMGLAELSKAAGDEALWDRAVALFDRIEPRLGRPSDTPLLGYPLEADMKLWWPHGETLYALLLAWAYSDRSEIGPWYHQVHEYTFHRFPDSEYGEWFGYLNRDGSPVFTAKANGWKGCFHLPRVLYRGWRLLCERAGPIVSAEVARPESARGAPPHHINFSHQAEKPCLPETTAPSSPRPTTRS